MKTIHIDTERTWRGGEQQAIYLARGLVRRGHHALLVGQPESPFVERARALGLRTRGLPMRGELDAAAAIRLAAILRRERPDIVHLHSSHAHALGVLASRMAHAGRTVVSRRVDFTIHKVPLRLNVLKYRLGVDRYVAISRGVRDVLVRDGIPEERVRVVPSGVDLEELRSIPARDYRSEFGIPSRAPVIGNVAHFGWHKAQEEIVKACPLIWKELPEARVVLVGDGDRREQVERMAREMRLDGRLIFTGDRDDARGLIRWFDVFVISSVMEGLCTSILDAHVLGTPVVATRVGGIPEIVAHEDSGLLVPPRDPPALAEAVTRLASDRGLGLRLNRAGQNLVAERYSADAMVDGILSVYRDLLERIGAGCDPC